MNERKSGRPRDAFQPPTEDVGGAGEERALWLWVDAPGSLNLRSMSNPVKSRVTNGFCSLCQATHAPFPPLKNRADEGALA